MTSSLRCEKRPVLWQVVCVVTDNDVTGSLCCDIIVLLRQVRVSRSVPTWVRVAPNVAVADVGSSAEFMCEVGEEETPHPTWGEAEPAARYSWYKDGRQLASTPRISLAGEGH